MTSTKEKTEDDLPIVKLAVEYYQEPKMLQKMSSGLASHLTALSK